jgi:hypothetical protein
MKEEASLRPTENKFKSNQFSIIIIGIFRHRHTNIKRLGDLVKKKKRKKETRFSSKKG